MPRPGVPKKWTRSQTVLEPHMLVVLDPPSKANSSKFKSGTVVGTCQMTSVKCVDERTKVKVSDLIVQYPGMQSAAPLPAARCRKTRTYFMNKKQEIKVDSEFILEASLVRNDDHKECYNCRHLQVSSLTQCFSVFLFLQKTVI